MVWCKNNNKTTDSDNQPITLCAYPRDDQYCNQLYGALEKYNIFAIAGKIGFRWIFHNKNRFSVLHFHWPSFYYGRNRIVPIVRFFLFLAFARLLGKKILWTVHNLYPHRVKTVNKFDYLARTLMILFSDLLFVHGPTAKEILTKEFLLARFKRICIIEHGNYLGRVLNEVPFSEARKQLGILVSDYVYLFFGKANPYKGLDDLIDAYKLVTDDNDRLIIAGRFPNKNYLRKIKQKIQDSGTTRKKIILFDRRIDDNEVQIFLNAASIMVLPYKYKSVLTSGIALFGLSFGLPIIAPRLGYFNDLICDSKLGLLYENGSSIDELAELMKKVKKMSFDRIGIMEHIRKYSWNAIGCRLNKSLRDNLL